MERTHFAERGSRSALLATVLGGTIPEESVGAVRSSLMLMRDYVRASIPRARVIYRRIRCFMRDVLVVVLYSRYQDASLATCRDEVRSKSRVYSCVELLGSVLATCTYVLLPMMMLPIGERCERNHGTSIGDERPS